jgi:hypothetical protein
MVSCSLVGIASRERVGHSGLKLHRRSDSRSGRTAQSDCQPEGRFIQVATSRFVAVHSHHL